MGGSTLLGLTRDVPGDDHRIQIGMTALILTDAIDELTESHTKRILRASPGSPEEAPVLCFLAIMALSCTSTLSGCCVCRVSVQAIALLTLNL